MSTTHDSDLEFAARLIADALIREAGQSTGHRRLVLRTFLGVPPADVFGALAVRLDPDTRVPVAGSRPPATLQAIPLPGDVPGDRRLLVPYLVGEPGPNRGTAGFAALLRDEVPAGPGRHVLLILDSTPVETVRTAAEDASTLPSLRWRSLASAATAGSRDALRPLLDAVLADDILPRTHEALGALRRSAQLSDVVQAGIALESLGCYVADSEAYRDPVRRLRKGARWRQTLDSWLLPGQDFERSLASKYSDESDAGLSKVLAARTPFGLKYSEFELDDLPADRAPSRPLHLAYPISTSGAACVSLGSRAVIWKSGGGSFGISLASAASADAAASVTWSDGGGPLDVPIAAGDREVRITATGSGWRFARLQLAAGQAAEIAVFLDGGRWAPLEASLDLDLDASAFRCSDQPRLLALGAGGELAGQPTLQLPDADPGTGIPRRCEAVMGAERHPIDLLIETEPADAGPGGGGEPAPGDGGDPGPGGGGQGPGSGEPPGGAGGDGPEPPSGEPDGPVPPLPLPGQPAPLARSVPHARLAARRSGQELGTPDFFATVDADGRRTGTIVTPGRFDLAPQLLAPGVDGLELERLVFASADVTAFALVRSAEGLELERHAYLDTLDVSAVRSFDAFMEARAMFFAAVAPKGSVHAVATGAGETEARRYVDAYGALLDEVLDGARFTAEHERIFLVDAIADGAAGELLIAPTHPLSVAYLLALVEKIDSWLPQAGAVLHDDLDACTMRHLVPYFALQGDWYETGADAPLLWRRYRPATVGVSAEHRPAYMAKRVDHFMRVHPEYRDARQRLALAFHEPGDGATVLEALRALVRPYARGVNTDPVPRLAVTIISSSETATRVENLVSRDVSSASADGPTDRLLQDRLEVVRVRPEEGLPEFAHLSFVFESSLDRQPAIVDLDARAGTLFADGLAAVPGRYIEPGRNETTFMWGTFTGRDAGGGLPGLARKTLEVVSGMPRDPISRGRTRMPSMRVGRTFLHDLYTNSAWVVHLDKLLGLEAFAPDASGRNARYLIDYEDRLDLAQPGLDAITATARIEPYRRALRQAVAELGRPTEAGLDRLLQLFNGVSGRWALDLVGANPNELHERIGLAAAIAAVQDLDGGLHGEGFVGVVVPMDEILDALPLGARPSKDRMCDDLLYVRVPVTPTARALLRGRLLEVKYRGSTDAGAAEVARRQLERAHAWLHATFNDADTPRRAFRSRDLAELLRAAATRASAFGLLALDDRPAFERALERVACGDFELRLDYVAGQATVSGDFVSIEADSGVPAYRQQLAGEGLSLGHLRLGRPALEALAAGRPMPRPESLPPVGYGDDPGSGNGAAEPTPSPGGPPTPPAATTSVPPASPTPSGGAPAPPEIAIMASRLDTAFSKYGLAVEPFSVELAQVGPSVVRFRTRTLGRLSIGDVERRARDIGREIAAPGEVQVGDEPGFVTVDVPRSEREAVPLAAVLPALDADPGKPGALQFVAGVAPSGRVEVADLSRLPHLLVAGATGSGKSVFLRGMLLELLRARTADQLHLLIIDPKRLDFASFARAPHVRGNAIISDPAEALERLQFTLEGELSLRQPILEDAGVSSAAEYYEAGGRLEELPQLVILVDEFADLVLAGSDRKAFSELVQRYAQLTRAYGIFLVLATQRPSVDVVTGSIKANLSARIAFSLPSGTDSRTVLDRNGAEDLLGDGDLLFYRNGRVERLQAPLTTLADVRTVLA
ncbi:MAG: segregation ATPase FtsK/SpoIIIE, family [Frankiaceae bacterium]|nr:segregation ATPase FtsK/SpoIIIE, family [Frankiaceae bacterium]